jgi:hypothetical protein
MDTYGDRGDRSDNMWGRDLELDELADLVLDEDVDFLEVGGHDQPDDTNGLEGSSSMNTGASDDTVCLPPTYSMVTKAAILIC